MNGSYFKNPTFPTLEKDDENDTNDVIHDREESSDIFGNNLKKKVSVYASYPYSNEFKVFNGIIEEVKDDYIIVKDIVKDVWYYILRDYINYIEFNEQIKIM